MDTLIKRDFPGIGGPGGPDNCHIIVGTKQLRKRLKLGGVLRVYLALDADPAITTPLEAQSLQKGIPCTWVRSMPELGRACGIQVGAAAAAVVAD